MTVRWHAERWEKSLGRLTWRRSRSARGRPAGSASTRSSCPRAATGRCSASCRSPSATRSWCSTRSRRRHGRPGAARRRDGRSRRSRSCCTPAARTWRSCGASGGRRSRTCSTRRSRPASRASRRRRATPACCTTCCKIRLAKSASFTRWDARPLTPEQLRYAREDVEHLLPLADEIQRRLTERGRLEWAREECRAIAEATDERDPEEVWRRLPRISGLDSRERAVARELAAWRERVAAAEDRPVGAIVRDPTLVELAKREPRTPKELGRDPRRGPGRRAPPRAATSSRRSSAAGPRRADPARRGRAARHRGGRRPDDRARRGARAGARAGGRAGLRADRRARGPRADRRRRAPRPAGARRAHAARLAARARRRGAARAARRAPPLAVTAGASRWTSRPAAATGRVAASDAGAGERRASGPARARACSPRARDRSPPARPAAQRTSSPPPSQAGARVPPWRSATCSTIASPRPEPGRPRAFEARKKRSKMCGELLGRHAGPVVAHRQLAARGAATSTSPPGGE